MVDKAEDGIAGTRSGCPIATTLDILGDKWTMVLIRDMLNGKTRYSQLTMWPEGIPTNILANRLKMMEKTGLVRRDVYQERPVRHQYLLTEKGRALLPVLQEICRWGNAYYPDTWVPPDAFMQPYVPAS